VQFDHICDLSILNLFEKRCKLCNFFLSIFFIKYVYINKIIIKSM
jgi:hypothetical protein